MPSSTAAKAAVEPEQEAEVEEEDGGQEEVSKGKPGDIHSQEFREFWQQLQPGAWLSSLLQDGYKIPVPELSRVSRAE